MPVYDRGYTHWEPTGGRAYPAWWVIAKRGIAEPLKKRWLLVLTLAAWIPAIIKAVMIYFKLQAGDIAELLVGNYASIDAAGFLSFMEVQRFFVFVLLAIVGAGLISTDRRDNGLSLYFSRPLGLASYIGGKAAIIMFFYAMVTLFPVYGLCLYAYNIAPDASGLELLFLIPLRATVYWLISGASISLVLLAFSSLGKRSVFVMVWWTIMVMGTETIGTIGKSLLQNDAFEALNFLGNYHNAAAGLFSSGPRLDVSPWVSLVVLLAWTFAAVLVLRKQIRPVEVVS